MKRYFLAIDIGASSGRHIVGWREDGEIKAKEVYRFPNGVQEQNGHLVWDVDALLSHVKAGIAAAKAEFPEIVSLSVDTWAVDYVLLRGEEEVRPVYAYRDSRTEAAIPKVHEILPFAELYAKTGCQFQPFNDFSRLVLLSVTSLLIRYWKPSQLPDSLPLTSRNSRIHFGSENGVTGAAVRT